MSLQKIKRRDKLIKIKTHLLIVVNEKNGANCLQLAPFGCVVTRKGQITNHFMEDLKRLAYW